MAWQQQVQLLMQRSLTEAQTWALTLALTDAKYYTVAPVFLRKYLNIGEGRNTQLSYSKLRVGKYRLSEVVLNKALMCTAAIGSEVQKARQ